MKLDCNWSNMPPVLILADELPTDETLELVHGELDLMITADGPINYNLTAMGLSATPQCASVQAAE